MKNCKRKIIISACFSILFGILIGGYLFSDTKPRSILALNQCENTCMNPNEIIGLLTSVGIQKFQDFIPSVIFETDKSIAIKHPLPQSPIHYVIFPKKDIKNISEISQGDEEYLIDCYALISKIIKDEGLGKYRVYTNGTGYQFTAYLHFHLQAENPK
jgi:hypothetical protein